jgi:hypothetical protein
MCATVPENDFASDAGTVIENDLAVYHEPDEFGVVETFYT